MTNSPPHRSSADDEPVDDLAKEAKDDNPDPQTRRETFELDLMEEGRSEEGESVSLDEAPETDK